MQHSLLVFIDVVHIAEEIFYLVLRTRWHFVNAIYCYQSEIILLNFRKKNAL